MQALCSNSYRAKQPNVGKKNPDMYYTLGIVRSRFRLEVGHSNQSKTFTLINNTPKLFPTSYQNMNRAEQNWPDF